ncbi:Gem-associated protein 2 [Ananas comosus]|uniref:Gem-associated protein 2 n=1 Tax=Ananas comosus TaxID=4615 RepID=A0A199W6L3_ANACO|nr:Gem-associated protein 2 [Ananas comosus]
MAEEKPSRAPETLAGAEEEEEEEVETLGAAPSETLEPPPVPVLNGVVDEVAITLSPMAAEVEDDDDKRALVGDPDPDPKMLKKRYSRTELERLMYANPEHQRRRWEEVYGSLGDAVSREYDGICAAADPMSRKKTTTKKKKQGGGGKKKKDPYEIVGKDSVVDTSTSLDVPNFHESGAHASSMNYSAIEQPCEDYEGVDDEDESSDDEYGSIQRPAFLVEGEPDFDSGPPLDGFEYLRRVRWEAAQIPKVKIAKINSNKLAGEQTPYMPKIPEIPRCLPEILPSKQWEDTFLAQFSGIREAFSQLESSCDQPLVTAGCRTSSKQPDLTEHAKSVPTLTMIRGMDAVVRAATLRNYVDMLESMDTLSRNDCLWLFALCVAVDTPLNADTCASLRSLLRKCSNLLANKSELDDEAAMLNILITITGKYFGQSENY